MSTQQWLEMDETTEAASRQIAAMGCDSFEVGLFKPNAPPEEPVMLPRTWDAATLLRSLPWLRWENREGRNIYVRPKGEHDLSLVDDLTGETVAVMKRKGFDPALVVETSPGNYQVWLRHPERLGMDLSTAAARKLAEKFGGDGGAADWRHFGRLAGFTNRKHQYRNSISGLFPFVRLIEATGTVYPEGERFIAEVKQALEEQTERRQWLRQQAAANQSHEFSRRKSIDVFRCDPRYSGDGNRIDLAYAIYAFSHEATEAEVSAAIRSRDLAHKGNQKRQDDYVDRTIRKAINKTVMPARER